MKLAGARSRNHYTGSVGTIGSGGSRNSSPGQILDSHFFTEKLSAETRKNKFFSSYLNYQEKNNYSF